jgi:thiol-disulfide isomerase/thioredoxin
VRDPIDLDRPRVRAPELPGGESWVGDEAISLESLRGSIVLLHFWTAGCINCIRVHEELRGLQRRFAGELVVIGVHTPKFAHERDLETVRGAIARSRIEHPVVADTDGTLWDAYAIRAWPTLVLIDATGRVAATVSGEGHAVVLASAIERLTTERSAAGVLAEHDPPPAEHGLTPPHQRRMLAFPGKVAVGTNPSGAPRIAIADSGNDRVLVVRPDGVVVGRVRGLYQPQGVRYDGPDTLLVCDTGADRLLRYATEASGEGEVITDKVVSPWDVVRWHGHLVIAGAGRHVLYAIDADGEVQVIAGTGREGQLDGPALQAQLAQPSALAITAEGELAFLDAEGSALRVLDRPGGHVRTLVGRGLHGWGDTDGDRDHAALQHPTGLAAAPDGALYIADTYNGLIRVWRGMHLWTVPLDPDWELCEPGGIDVLGDGRLVIADTGGHRTLIADPVSGEVGEHAIGGAPSEHDNSQGMFARPVVASEGDVLDVEIDAGDLDDGEMLDHAGGPPVRVRALAADDDLLGDTTEWELDEVPGRVQVPLGRGSGRLVVEIRVATCTPDRCLLRRTEIAYDVMLT